LVNATGTAINTVVWDAYGNVTSETGGANRGDYGYTGKRRDSETGLQQNGPRDYSVSTGNWWERDTIGFRGGLSNLSDYVGDDPTNATDPNGTGILYDLGVAVGSSRAARGLSRLFGNPSPPAPATPAPGAPAAEPDAPTKEIDVINLRDRHGNNPSKQVAFKVAVAIGADNSVTATVKEAAQFSGFPFQSYIAGAHKDEKNGGANFTEGYKDTDSVQVAIQWLDDKNNDVAHDTNAMKQEKRDVGAKWEFAGAAPKQTATYKSPQKAPAAAVKMNVVFVYTDALEDHADLAVIVGSFTATRKDANSPWTIEANPKDVFEDGKGISSRQQRDLQSDQADLMKDKMDDTVLTKELQDLQQKTADVLKKQTGYEMKRRIQTEGANKGKGLNSYQDTGYDIVIRK